MKKWIVRMVQRLREEGRRCPICSEMDCTSEAHAEEWLEITAW